MGYTYVQDVEQSTDRRRDIDDGHLAIRGTPAESTGGREQHVRGVTRTTNRNWSSREPKTISRWKSRS